VERFIGRGGAGEVYRVRHKNLGTHHALKVLTHSKPLIRQRLLNEGRIQAHLRHINVVAVSDVLEVGDAPGLLMEYLEGPSLASWLDKKMPSPDEALEIFQGILAGVERAHALGIVHRDLKPANVMLEQGPDGLIPKVMDFGLARALEDEEEDEDRDRLTRSGAALGTPFYMSPEQIRDTKSADTRADIFSLGCILYEMVCHRRPFTGADLVSVFNAVTSGRYTPPRALVPDLPKTIDQAIVGCLEVDREQRIRDCQMLRGVLAGTYERVPAQQESETPDQKDFDQTWDMGQLDEVLEEAGPRWLQVHVGVQASGGLQAALANSSDGRSTPSQALASLERTALVRLSGELQSLARGERPMPEGLRESARELFLEVFSQKRGEALLALRKGGSGSLLLSLLLDDPQLIGLPWEAMRGPGPLDGSLACQPDLSFVRGVSSDLPAIPREVSGPLRVLVVAPGGAPSALSAAGCGEQVDGSRLHWLPALSGRAAQLPQLLARLQQPPRPHVVHFACSGRLRGDIPELLLGDAEQHWCTAARLGEALSSSLANELRLVILQPTAEAQPASLVHAARQLAGLGPEAALAQLWHLEASANQRFARAFYGALVGANEGDIAASATQARLSLVSAGGVDFLSPVLCMRGTNPVLFEFRPGPKLQEQEEAQGAPAAAQLEPRHDRLSQRLQSLLAAPCTLLVGENIDPEGGMVGRRQLEGEFRSLLERNRHEPLSALMQRFELAEEREELRAVFQEVLEASSESRRPPGVIEWLAHGCGPGLTITLLWLPLLEEALAHHQSDREIIVIQPLKPGALDRLRLFRWAPKEQRWLRERRLPRRFDFNRQFVVLRLFGGYAAPSRSMLGDPVLTDDDQLFHLRVIDSLPTQLLAYLRHHKMAIVGLSPLFWGHRELLRRLTGNQPLVSGSIAVLNPDADQSERRYWESEAGPAGLSGGVDPVQYQDLSIISSTLP